ncbi:hypothetical protein T484DRAFT_1745166 [Baffinella frigidus]|nr:hypothetical protein T484DRAFT_1745166 [Cryptophyta sp. CCMP2293]
MCCLRDMKNVYDLDVSWSQRLETQEMQACDNQTAVPSYENTNVFSGNVFPEPLVASTVLQGGSVDAIPGVQYTYTLVDGEHQIELRMATTYIQDRAKVTLINAGTGTFKYEFFVGTVFATLRERSPNIYTTVIQQNIEFTKSDFGFFAIGTEQDRSIIKQVETFIHQGKNPVDAALYQYIEVNVDFDPSRSQGDNTVKILTDTMRYVKAAVAPTDTSTWVFPCSPTGFFVGAPNSWTELILKQCLPDDPVFCTENIANGRFWVPFDVSSATAQSGYISANDKINSLFFSFEVEFKNSVLQTNFVETIYGTINLVNFPVLEHCMSGLLGYEDVTNTLKVSVELGTDTPTISGRDNGLIQTLSGTGAVVNQMSTVAPSYGAAVMSIVVDGLDFAGEYSTKYQMDNLLIFNFLGASSESYNGIMTKIKSGTGLTIEKTIGDDHFTITPNFGTSGADCQEVATNSGMVANTVINCLWRRAIVANIVKDSAVQSVYYKKDATAANDITAISWVRQTFFPEDGDDGSSVKFLHEHCPKAYANTSEYRALHNGAYGCIFVDPGYRWLSKAGRNDIKNPLMISDKTVVIGIVTVSRMDYANVDTNGNPTNGAPMRRLFSMDGDGSNMQLIPMANGGEQEMQEKLSVEYSNNALSTPRIFTRGQMRDRLKKAFSRRLRPTFQTKLATIGTKELRRKLLQSDDVLLDDLIKDPSNEVFSVANPFVNASVNIATMVGYEQSDWLTWSVKVRRDAAVPMPIFTQCMNTYIQHASKFISGGVQAGTTTGFRFTPDTITTGRNLLQVTAYNGVSGTVDMDGIFQTDSHFGEMFNKMFYCIVNSAAHAANAQTATAGFILDVLHLETTVSTCAVANSATAEITDVRDAMILSCGKKTQLLSADKCNTLYKALVLTVPTIAFDWFSVQNASPQLFFKVHVGRLINPQVDATTIYNIRSVVASVLTAPMDRVRVEVREMTVVSPTIASSRRLLAADIINSVVYVWVYAGGGLNTGLPSWPPAGDLQQLYQTTYKAPMQTKLTELLGYVVVEATAETSAISTVPFRPLLDEFSVTFAVDFVVTRTADLAADITAMTTAIKTAVGTTLTIPQTDIRILSVQNTPTSAKPRFSVEVRTATAVTTELAETMLKTQWGTISTFINAELVSQNRAMGITSVKLRSDSVVSIVNSQRQGKAETSNVGLIVGIVVGVVALIVVIVIFMMRHKSTADVEDGVAVDGMKAGNTGNMASVSMGPNYQGGHMYVCPQPMVGMHPRQEYSAMYRN